MHHQDILDKEVSMRCKYYFIIFFVTFTLLGCSQKNTGISSYNPPVNQSMFDAFLEQFETLYPNDTMMDLTISLFESSPFYGHSKEIDSSTIQYVAPIPPFFKASPSFKVECKEGWYVFLVHQYEVANIELKYIDVISYDFNGNMVHRMSLPFTDGHGGLYWDLDERYSNQGTIAISRDYLDYRWYCEYRTGIGTLPEPDSLFFRYKILPDGSMVQVDLEETKNR